jgi:hypothetical protein
MGLKDCVFLIKDKENQDITFGLRHSGISLQNRILWWKKKAYAIFKTRRNVGQTLFLLRNDCSSISDRCLLIHVLGQLVSRLDSKLTHWPTKEQLFLKIKAATFTFSRLM